MKAKVADVSTGLYFDVIVVSLLTHQAMFSHVLNLTLLPKSQAMLTLPRQTFQHRHQTFWPTKWKTTTITTWNNIKYRVKKKKKKKKERRKIIKTQVRLRMSFNCTQQDHLQFFCRHAFFAAQRKRLRSRSNDTVEPTLPATLERV